MVGVGRPRLWGGGQAAQQRVEVLEDVPVLLINRSVGLVDHHQGEVARAESSRAAVSFVDQAHHGGLSRQVDAAVDVFCR